ncbi:MAG TPA: response regulator transcription factor [Gemmatimonadales bacterium]|nr:response regulator transcription factor [Gemmatimonadales bacterium]
MKRVRVLLVDDHPLVREGIRLALNTPGFQVVGEAANATEGFGESVRLQPDVVVMDISLPGESGLSVATRLLHEMPSTRILMLSVYHQAEYVLEAVRIGAHGYLLKDTQPADLREAVRTVANGGTHFARALSSSGASESPPLSPDTTASLGQLTQRERQVLTGIAEGHTNKEIAAGLGLSPRTVESYRESLIRKLGIPSVAGLTKFALDAKLLR